MTLSVEKMCTFTALSIVIYAWPTTLELGNDGNIKRLTLS